MFGVIDAFPGPRKTSNLSQSHGHLNFAKDDRIQSLLPNSLDYKRQLSLLEGEGRSPKTAQRTSSDGLHHRIKAVDEAASILSFGSMVSIDEMASFTYYENYSDELSFICLSVFTDVSRCSVLKYGTWWLIG